MAYCFSRRCSSEFSHGSMNLLLHELVICGQVD
uniref:Uncharacterized protein n=1 Tax=Triticum urartu TaxID=4572 RepID=A0A8R7QW54_TRIUA